MILKSSFSIIFLIFAVNGCTEPECDEVNSNLEWQSWRNSDSFDKRLTTAPLREKQQDEIISKVLENLKSKRAQDHLSSDLGFETIRNNAELSRTLLQQIFQNVQRSQDFVPRSNRADSKENYHLQASYIPRLG